MRNLCRVLLIQHGVENGLREQARRETGIAALADEGELVLANGAIEHGCLRFTHLSYIKESS